MFGPGNTTLTISNEKMNDIIKVDKSLEEFRLLVKSISETIKKKQKKKRRISWNVMRHFRC